MTKSMTRLVIGAVGALALAGLTSGIASAAQPAPAALTTTVPAAGASAGAPADVPIWLLPGVDLGSVLDPTIGIPTEVLGPVDGLLTLVNG
jgi:hypothetical protein